MRKAKDLTGQRFGKLIAVEPTELRDRGAVVWRCLCDCGGEKLVATGSLMSGNTKSCGCASRCAGVDLTGQKFGRLTAIRPTQKRQCGSIVWLCRCDCGREVWVGSGDLRSGNTKSCGCLRDDIEK